MRRTTVGLLSLLVFAGCVMPQPQPLAAQDADQANEPIDWQKARALLQRERAGERLTPEDQAYLDRAKQARAQRGQQSAAPPPRATTGLRPLTEMTAEDRYQDQDGGLYGAGLNEPPAEHLALAMAAAAQVQPLAADGTPSPDGKIALLSVGMSNTTQEFSAFMPLAAADPLKSPKVVMIDGAQGGRVASHWADPTGGVQESPDPQRPGRPSVWDAVTQRMERAAVTPGQVQVAWIKEAEAGPAQYGEFPAHAEALANSYAGILVQLQQRFPNLRLAYFSSRIYAGHATTPLNPEPYAYESAYAVRWTIQRQMQGDPALNADPAKGEVTAPVALWGPYLWADGTTARAADGLVWLREDLGPDGTHPSPAGRQKVAAMLLRFFQTDPTAQPWYLAQPAANP